MHPVQYTAEYEERRSRLTTFLRYLLVIPHAFVLELYAIGALAVSFVAWFAIIITGRYPQGMFGFVTGYLRYSMRVSSYLTLAADRFPPFGSGGQYSADVQVAYPDRVSRLKTFFRWLLVIPAAIIQYVVSIVAGLATIVLWFACVILGRAPRGLFDFVVMAHRYQARTMAYALNLTDRYPSFEEPGAAPLPIA